MTDFERPENPVAQQPEQRTTPAAEKEQNKPGLISRMARVLLRLLVVVILGVALGAGLFYGAIDLYRNTIEPMRTIDGRMAELETKLELQVESSDDQVTKLQTRVAEMEGAAAVSIETMAEMKAEISTLQDEVARQQDQLSSFDGLADRTASITQDLTALSERMDTVENVIAEQDLPTQRILRDLQLLRTMTLLTRASGSLNQVNLGLAQVDMLAARDILVSIQPAADVTDVPAGEPSIQAALARLESALESVLTNRAVAEEELEISWQYLIAITAPPPVNNPDGLAE